MKKVKYNEDNLNNYIKYFNEGKYKDNSNDNKFTKKTNTKNINNKKSNK